MKKKTVHTTGTMMKFALVFVLVTMLSGCGVKNNTAETTEPVDTTCYGDV